MKKRNLLGNFIVILLLACLPACTGFQVSTMSSLQSISQPYLGVYKCKTARFGNEDFLKSYEFLTLELKSQGEYVLMAKPKNGHTTKKEGKYEYDTESEVITISETIALKPISAKFKVENGTIQIRKQFASQLFYAEFSLSNV